MHQHAVALADTVRRQAGGRCLYAATELAPAPASLAADDRGAVGEAPRRLQQQTGEVRCWDQRAGSRIDT
jgi:hypothetical protein